MNYDTGVVPVSIMQIQKQIATNASGLACIGGLSNLGIGICAIVAIFFFKKFPIKKVMVSSLIVNMLSCLGFAFAQNLWEIYIARVIMGLSQAFWIIYTPVWINLCSPKEYRATWLGIFMGFSPLGIIFGYILTAVLIGELNVDYSWRISILFQALCLLLPCIIMLFVRSREIDIMQRLRKNSAKGLVLENDEISEENDIQSQYSFLAGDNVQYFKRMKTLIKNPIYMWTSLALTVLYFIVFGIQFWGTQYMIKVLGMTFTKATILFVVCTITAPIFGVYIGGRLCDFLGGYQGKHRFTAIKLVLFFVLLDTGFALTAGFAQSIWDFYPLFWFLIFFGGCIVPPATGIIISSVPRELQTVSSSLSQLLNNTLGYFLSPVFSGFIIDQFPSDEKREGLIQGFRANLFTSFLAIIFILLSYYSIRKFTNKHYKKQPNLPKLTQVSSYVAVVLEQNNCLEQSKNLEEKLMTKA